MLSTQMSSAEFWSLVGAAESVSEHPLAQAVVTHAKQVVLDGLPAPDQFEVRRSLSASAIAFWFFVTVPFTPLLQTIPGRGLRAVVRGRAVVAGNRQWMEQCGLVLDTSSQVRKTDLASFVLY
jgi:cation transport ATPase